jgi:hypothetical protein
MYSVWRIDNGIEQPCRYYVTDDRILAHSIAHAWNRRYKGERYAVFAGNKKPGDYRQINSNKE